MSGKVSVMIAIPAYGHSVDNRLIKWIAKLTGELEQDNRVRGYSIWEGADTPITMERNRALSDAQENGIDFVFFLDTDTIPDLYVRESWAKPFWKSSFDFAMDSLARKGLPTVVAAPYCGPSPHSCVYVFDWVNFRNPGLQPDGRDVACDFALEMVPRHEAANRRGIQPAAALPTGCMLIDMRAVKPLKHPYFDYEWSDQRAIKKASTEDVYFTRNLNYVWADHGVVCFCNWDAWAGHVKQEIVGKPQNYPPAWLPQHLVQTCRQAVDAGKVCPPSPISAEVRVRERNSFAAPPKGWPVELIRVRETPAPEADPADEQTPPPELEREFEASLNGHAAGVPG